ncbi:hypothetical protein II898_08775 [bacterium]|nr:hypothetical protein [bacterium]
MRFFKILALICLFVLFVGCEDSIQRITPAADKPDDGNSDVTDDSDATDTDDPANPTDEPTNPTDEPTNPTDPTDEPTNPTDDPTDPTDDPTNPTDEPTNPTDDEDIIPDEDNPELTDEEKCAAAGGTWDSFAEEDFERCYKIVECAAKPANTEWRGDQSYTEYYDIDDGQWTNFGANYTTEYGDTGEAKICQYICASNALREDDTCKPICSAVFNGSSSKVVVSHNELLNLNHFWTIEAWVKQDLNNLSTKESYIVKKGSKSYSLTGFYKSTEGMNPMSQKTYYNMEGGFYYPLTQMVENDMTVEAKYQNTAADSPIVSGWNHIALSYYIKSGTAHLRLYINGRMTKEKTASTSDRAPKTVEDNLTIGYYGETTDIGGGIISIGGDESYFKGQIDQLKIGKKYYEDEFSPSQLSVDDDGNTIAFYDFSNDANDSSGNGLNGSGTNVTYSTDCAF